MEPPAPCPNRKNWATMTNQNRPLIKFPPGRHERRARIRVSSRSLKSPSQSRSFCEPLKGVADTRCSFFLSFSLLLFLILFSPLFLLMFLFSFLFLSFFARREVVPPISETRPPPSPLLSGRDEARQTASSCWV